MLVSAREVPLRDLCNITNIVFRDTPAPLRFGEVSFSHYINRMDICLEASQVFVHEGKPAGVVLVAKRNQRAHLCVMGLIPALRRQGVGSTLLAAAVERAGSVNITLEVAARNLAALGLYRRHGFQVIARHQFWYACLPMHLQGNWDVTDVGAELALNVTRSPVSPWIVQSETLQRDLTHMRGALISHKQHVRGACLFYPGLKTIVVSRLTCVDTSVLQSLLRYMVKCCPAAQFISVRWLSDDNIRNGLRTLGFKSHSEHYTMQLKRKEP